MTEPTSRPLIHHVAPIELSEDSRPIRGVVFDMDGTLIHEAIDYASMRLDLGIPQPLDVILEINSMTDVAKQQEFVSTTTPKLCASFGSYIRHYG